MHMYKFSSLELKYEKLKRIKREKKSVECPDLHKSTKKKKFKNEIHKSIKNGKKLEISIFMLTL
jgi:hypothetical protein